MPPKKKEPLTDDEKFQAQLQQEHDLARLQHQYAYLNKCRAQFSIGATKFQRQNKVFEIFQKEHQNIITDLNVANAPEKKRDDAKNSELLTNLLYEYDDFTDQVAEKKKYIEEIEGQIKMVQKDVHQLEAKQITDRQYEDRVWNAMKTVEALDNKLELQTRKFCGICGENQTMRGEINHLLRERQNFMKIWNKLIKQLTIGKKFMLDLIEQATIAYDQREDWCSKLQALRIKAHQDFQLHSQEMRQLKRKKDDQKKIEDFFSIKGQKRVMRDLVEKERLKRYEHKQVLKNLLVKYRTMVRQIMDFSGERQVTKIVEKFCRIEAQNFSNFRLITDLIYDMENATDQLGRLHLEIDEKRAVHEERSGRQQNVIVDLEEKLSLLKAEEETQEAELKTCDETLQQLIQGIDSLCKLCKCHNDPLLELLGDHSQITWYNVLLYQQLLEKKVLHVILNVAHRDKGLLEKKKISGSQKIVSFEDKDSATLLSLDKVVDSNPCPLCVEHEIVSDVIDTVQCVYTRQQAKRKLAERLKLPDALGRIHNVSACHLPKSREIIQKRYA